MILTLTKTQKILGIAVAIVALITGLTGLLGGIFLTPSKLRDLQDSVTKEFQLMNVKFDKITSIIDKDHEQMIRFDERFKIIQDRLPKTGSLITSNNYVEF